MIKYDNDYEMSYEDLTKCEQKIYEQQIIKDEKTFLHSPIKIDFNSITCRNTDFITDKIYNLPQTIFLIKYRNKQIVGRKIRSILSITNKINAINCSRITASMLLGVLKNKTNNHKNIVVEYYPMTEHERVSLFQEIVRDPSFEIIFPYQERYFTTNQVEKTGKDGWTLNPRKVKYLGYGEEHIRKYTKGFLKNIIFDGCRVYDPACSTGQFLYELKQSYPMITTIGGDLSKQMIEYAQNYLDFCECCNAKDSTIQENSIDIMFLRFLNDQVVSKYQAHQILPKILKKVKTGGYVFAFGHTPVLLTKKQFEHFGLKVDSCIAYNKDENNIFQFYVMRKIDEQLNNR